MMIRLGSFDSDTTEAARAAYLAEVQTLTRVPLSEIVPGIDRLVLEPCEPDTAQPMSVAEVQRGLATIGFFPGGKVDGICGYRTQSAIRLFQEYVRSVEQLVCLPDGRFGPGTQHHLQRWLDQRVRFAWAPAMARWQAGTTQQTEYGE